MGCGKASRRTLPVLPQNVQTKHSEKSGEKSGGNLGYKLSASPGRSTCRPSSKTAVMEPGQVHLAVNGNFLEARRAGPILRRVAGRHDGSPFFNCLKKVEHDYSSGNSKKAKFAAQD
ncbi:hypothetical protein DFH09DRAFT_1081870 [Mycena vulgaris]|nr:hypothetical protein DFH09DRAFT_1081870 [Mycena vulgaris]